MNIPVPPSIVAGGNRLSVNSAIDNLSLRGSGWSVRAQYLILKGSEVLLSRVNHRGLRRVCRWISPFFARDNSAIVELQGRRIRVFLNDDYWVRYALFGSTYEAEIANVLDELLDCRSVFLDCGANIGYWSVYAGKRIGSRDRVVAVEPSVSTFARLAENSELNGYSFSVARKAVYSRSGESLQFRVDEAHHDSNSIIHDVGSRGEPVDSITVDDLFDSMPIVEHAISSIVVKLDVEGAEREAFQGAQRLISRGAVFIYEDHGSDPTCASTEFALKSGLEVHFLDSEMAPVRILDLTQLAALKTCCTKGYNLAAGRRDSAAMTRLIAGLTRRIGKEAPVDSH